MTRAVAGLPERRGPNPRAVWFGLGLAGAAVALALIAFQPRGLIAQSPTPGIANASPTPSAAQTPATEPTDGIGGPPVPGQVPTIELCNSPETSSVPYYLMYHVPHYANASIAGYMEDGDPSAGPPLPGEARLYVAWTNATGNNETTFSGSVKWRTRDGSAVAGEDYQPSSGAWSWRYAPDAGGLDSAEPQISILLVDDDLPESPESFFIDLYDPAGDGVIACATAEVIIYDDDVRLILSVGEVVEGSGNAVTELEVFVQVAGPQPDRSQVTLTVNDGTATASEDYIFAPDSGSVTMEVARYEELARFVVSIRGDDVDEPDETLMVSGYLSVVIGDWIAHPLRGRHLEAQEIDVPVTIIDDDDGGATATPTPRTSSGPGTSPGIATLTVIKDVINDDGGDLVAEDFTLFVDGQVVHSGVPTTVAADISHAVTEAAQPGYSGPVYGGACDAAGTVALRSGESATCTLRNEDDPPYLRLVKLVVNDDGGSAVPNDFLLTATTGAPNDARNFANLGAAGGFRKVFANVAYELAEVPDPEYTAGSWSCDGGTLVGNNLALVLGDEVTCTIANDDTGTGTRQRCVAAWGLNDKGQAGRPAADVYVAVAAGGRHSLALRANGSIFGWGDNTFGQATPPGGNDYIAIAAGGYHSLALTKGGNIVGWGDNTFGQATAPAGSGYIAISAGGSHSLALKADGSIVGWGNNTYGQRTPPAGSGYLAIAAGGNHSLALRADRSIVGWGRNNYGQRTPPAGTGYSAIAAGGNHSLALQANGGIVGWGDNTYRQRTPPAGVAYRAIAAGGNHSVALRDDYTIVGWGRNNYGQRTPPAGFWYLGIAAGGNHSLATSRKCYQPDALIRKGTGVVIGKLIFNDDGTNQTSQGSASTGQTVKFRISIQNVGSLPDSFLVKATGASTSMYSVKYMFGTVDITATVVAGTYRTTTLIPGATYSITVKVTVKSSATVGSSVTRLVTIASLGSPATVDTVKLVGRRS